MTPAATCTDGPSRPADRPASKPAEFDDRVGYSALLISGHYPQKHMKNQKGSELCLFDKQRKTAFITEWTPAKP